MYPMVDLAPMAPVRAIAPDTHEQRLHVLISAYACDPNRGSEPGVGWNWVKHLSKHCRLSVITRANNRRSIQSWLQDHPLPDVRFYYVDPPSKLTFWKRKERGLYLYYMTWQSMALRVAREVLAADPYDLAHHVTFASLHMPIFLQRLPVPFVFGPVGGGEMSCPQFWAGGGWRALAYERLRTWRMNTVRWDPLVQATLAEAVHILVTTPHTTSFIPERYASKTTVMPTVGIEAVNDLPAPAATGDGPRIYAAGRLVHWKGFHLAIEAFARIAPRFPNMTFTIVGDGPQRAALERLADQSGFRERIRTMPWLSRTEVLALTQASDVLLYPSLHDSGSMVVLEAMAAGKPVICLDTGGPGVMVTSECGVKVPVTTPENVVADLADGLERVAADRELRRRMGDAARARVHDRFTWERKAEQMLPLYHGAVRA